MQKKCPGSKGAAWPRAGQALHFPAAAKVQFRNVTCCQRYNAVDNGSTGNGIAAPGANPLAQPTASTSRVRQILSDPSIEGDMLSFLDLSEAYWKVRAVALACTTVVELHLQLALTCAMSSLIFRAHPKQIAIYLV